MDLFKLNAQLARMYQLRWREFNDAVSKSSGQSQLRSRWKLILFRAEMINNLFLRNPRIFSYEKVNGVLGQYDWYANKFGHGPITGVIQFISNALIAKIPTQNYIYVFYIEKMSIKPTWESPETLIWVGRWHFHLFDCFFSSSLYWMNDKY